jgi:hypothetical protein
MGNAGIVLGHEAAVNVVSVENVLLPGNGIGNVGGNPWLVGFTPYSMKLIGAT